MARRKAPVTVHLISSATREGLDALLDDVAAGIWTDVSPKGGGRPKKAGRPRAIAENRSPRRQPAVAAPEGAGGAGQGGGAEEDGPEEGRARRRPKKAGARRSKATARRGRR